MPDFDALPLLATVAWNTAGLVPGVAQRHDTGEVLMLAWMDRAAVEELLATSRVCHHSRRRGVPWRKGETSGQVQRLVDLRLDCDGDAPPALVDQTGVASHTGRRSCFFCALRNGSLAAIAAPTRDPAVLYGPVPMAAARP